MEKYLRIGTSFVKRQYFPHILLTLVFCAMSGGIMSFQNLSESQSAKVLELYVSFVGILLLTPLFLPEQDGEIWHLEKSKATPLWQLYLIRLLIGIAGMIAVTTIFLYLLKNGNSEVLFQRMWIGAFGEMLLLGAVGFFVSAITNQVILGYMLAVMYYAMNIGNNKFLGKLALFQMTQGQYDFAGWMICVSCLLFVFGILIRERKK